MTNLDQRLEEAAMKYADENDGGSNPRYNGLEEGFIEGAKWAMEQIAEKDCFECGLGLDKSIHR